MSETKIIEWTKEVQKKGTSGKVVLYKTEIGGIFVWLEYDKEIIGGWRVSLDKVNQNVISEKFVLSDTVEGQWLPKWTPSSAKREALKRVWNGIVDKKKKDLISSDIADKQLDILEPYMDDLDNKNWCKLVLKIIKLHKKQGLCKICEKPKKASCEDYLNGNPEAQARVAEAYKEVVPA